MKTKTAYMLLAVLTAFTVLSCNRADLSTEKGKYSYSIGFNIGSNMKRDSIDIDTGEFSDAVEASLAGKKGIFTAEQNAQEIQNLIMSIQNKNMKGAGAAPAKEVKTDKSKYSYAIGYDIGSKMKKDEVELDLKSFLQGFKDGIKGKEKQITQELEQQAMQGLMAKVQKKKMKEAEENKKKSEVYLAENKKKPGVFTTASGLQYKVIKQAVGQRPFKTSMVKVHYSGKLTDGTEFDSSYKRNEPAQFKLDGVIKGWTEGLQLMSVGSKYELTIPGDLGYGPMGNQNIPGNAVLVFEIELISIEK